MPVFQCDGCGVVRTCDWPAADDWPDGILRGVPPDCTNPECDSEGCVMEFLWDEADQPTIWTCRRCKAVGGHDRWTTRYGILECGVCLQLGYVGLLEPKEK